MEEITCQLVSERECVGFDFKILCLVKKYCFQNSNTKHIAYDDCEHILR